LFFTRPFFCSKTTARAVIMSRKAAGGFRHPPEIQVLLAAKSANGIAC
jgi:hypothetical protein